MKGIIVENINKESIVMTEDGLFTKIKNNHYEVGQTVKVVENKKTLTKLALGAASMVAALAVCTIGGFAYYTPTDYVSLDVNPSIEYSVNRFDRILDVKAVNDDGGEILSSLDLNNMNVEDALIETLDQLMAEGYLTDDPNGGVIITTSNEELGDAEELAVQLEEEIQGYLDGQESIVAKVDAEAVGLDRVEEARELGVSPGKLNLVEKLQASTDSAINVEEWLAMPVKDINKAIKENKGLAKDKLKDQIENDASLEPEDANLDDIEKSKNVNVNTNSKNEHQDVPANVTNNKNKNPEDNQIPQNDIITNENQNQDDDQAEQKQEKVKNDNSSSDENPSDDKSQSGNSNSNSGGNSNSNSGGKPN